MATCVTETTTEPEETYSQLLERRPEWVLMEWNAKLVLLLAPAEGMAGEQQPRHQQVRTPKPYQTGP